jgi:hypothetical protein
MLLQQTHIFGKSFGERSAPRSRHCTFSLAQAAILDSPAAAFGRKIRLNLGFQPLLDSCADSPLQFAAALCGSHLFLRASAYEEMPLMLHCSSI